MTPAKLPDLQELIEVDVQPTPAVLAPLLELLKAGDQVITIRIDVPRPLRAWADAVVEAAATDDTRDGFRVEDIDDGDGRFGRSRLTIRAQLRATDEHLLMLDTALQALEAAAAS